jgi:hypothetical protein
MAPTRVEVRGAYRRKARMWLNVVAAGPRSRTAVGQFVRLELGARSVSKQFDFLFLGSTYTYLPINRGHGAVHQRTEGAQACPRG